MEEKLLSRKNSAMLHGAAILMMIYHHLFVEGNGSYVRYGVSFFDLFNPVNIGPAPTAQMSFARFCKICVAVFAFTSGYAMFVQLDRTDRTDLRQMYSYCLKRLWSFFRKYLLVFIFVTAVEMFLHNPYEFDFSPINLILNALGIRSDYNATWWYVAVYYCMVLSSPLIFSFLKRISPKKQVLIILTAGILAAAAILGLGLATGDLMRWIKIASNLLQSALSIYMIIFIEGMLCARYGLTDRIADKLNVPTSVIVLLAVVIVRVLLIRTPGDSVFDVILIILFTVSFTKLVSCSEKLSAFFRFFGKYSAFMWYWHAYFYAYLFFVLIIRSDISLLVYVQVVLYTLLASVIFTYLEKGLVTGFRKPLGRS